jgi:hypothetical protein
MLLLRKQIVNMLDDFTTDMVEKPTVDGRGNIADFLILRDLELIMGIFKAYEELVMASKDASYKHLAVRDLPDDERSRYRAVKHKLDLLWALYGPKSEA